MPKAEIAKRRAAWKQPKPRYTRGLFAKYMKLVSSGSLCAITDMPVDETLHAGTKATKKPATQKSGEKKRVAKVASKPTRKGAPKRAIVKTASKAVRPVTRTTRVAKKARAAKSKKK